MVQIPFSIKKKSGYIRNRHNESSLHRNSGAGDQGIEENRNNGQASSELGNIGFQKEELGEAQNALKKKIKKSSNNSDMKPGNSEDVRSSRAGKTFTDFIGQSAPFTQKQGAQKKVCRRGRGGVNNFSDGASKPIYFS
jgi:hypothetical protein